MIYAPINMYVTHAVYFFKNVDFEIHLQLKGN